MAEQIHIDGDLERDRAALFELAAEAEAGVERVLALVRERESPEVAEELAGLAHLDARILEESPHWEQLATVRGIGRAIVAVGFVVRGCERMAKRPGANGLALLIWAVGARRLREDWLSLLPTDLGEGLRTLWALEEAEGHPC